MTNFVTVREERRLVIQAELDKIKDQAERNRLGQFATPTELALEILEYAKRKMADSATVRFVDPAVGTGSFFSALLEVFSSDSLASAVGYEIDPHYSEPAAKFWQDSILDIRQEDFTAANAPMDEDRFNLLICNPPYVRHHHISSAEKHRLKALIHQASSIEISGLAGLYCYFLGLSHQWMADGGLAGWLIPSEFMDVNYGAAVKHYLLDKVTLHHIHRFDPNEVQFGDALVSSSVVWFSKDQPPPNHEVRMTFGGTLLQPKLERLVSAKALHLDSKWTRYPMRESRIEQAYPKLSDFFDIKRGLATGNNSYFILPIEEIARRGLPIEAFRPILPSPRYLPETEIVSDANGNPMVDRQMFLLDCLLPEEVIKERLPVLGAYLEEGKAEGIADGYLCRHRTPWYGQERRPATPFLCTYLGRSNKKNSEPFRFILNHSMATAPNVYLMLYPKGDLDEAIAESPQLKRQIWECLKSIGSKDMLNEGRVYGGGLHKLEPGELGKVPALALANLLRGAERRSSAWQAPLIDTTLFQKLQKANTL